MAGNFTPTPNERQFLRAIAAGNPSARRGEESWWSPDGLRITALFPDFRNTAKLTLVSLGRSCARKGLAVSRRAGRHSHSQNYFTEYQATSYGREQVADSCIGGGLPWRTGDGAGPDVRVECPACHADYSEMGVPRPVREPVAGRWRGEVPAHPLPGYAPAVLSGEARHG